jgi:hypothetical protein
LVGGSNFSYRVPPSRRVGAARWKLQVGVVADRPAIELQLGLRQIGLQFIALVTGGLQRILAGAVDEPFALDPRRQLVDPYPGCVSPVARVGLQARVRSVTLRAASSGAWISDRTAAQDLTSPAISCTLA